MLRLLAVIAFALLPVAVQAEEDFNLQNEGPPLNGTWQIRNFTISSEGSDNWAQPYNGEDTVTFAEAEDGGLTGTMTIYGDTFPITGEADYGKDRVIVTWSGEFDNEGTKMRRSFHAYVLPHYAYADEQVEMLAGTTGVVEVGATFGGSGSFIAVPMEF